MVIYQDSQISITAKNKKDFVIQIEHWDSTYKKFWVNFPFVLLNVTSKNTDADKRIYTITAGKVEMLDDIIKRRRMPYNECMSLMYDVGNQIQSLEMFGIGIPFIKPNDILVVDSKHFFIVNTNRILQLSNNMLTIDTPYKKSAYFSPEMLNITAIPSNIHWKSAYYSLASLVVYCLTGVDILGSKNSPGENLDKIYATKLYWALLRCLEPKPQDRYYLLI